jgi:hypothetical protein
VCLTERQTSRSGAKAGLNDPLFDYGIGRAYRIKATPGIHVCPDSVVTWNRVNMANNGETLTV